MLDSVSWRLALGLALLNLVRPLLSIVGAFDDIRPAGPIVVTVLLAVAWVAAAVVARPEDPVATLAAAGALYGVGILLLTAAVWLVARHLDPQFPPPPGLVAVVLFNAALGAVLGLVARALTQAR